MATPRQRATSTAVLRNVFQEVARFQCETMERHLQAIQDWHRMSERSLHSRWERLSADAAEEYKEILAEQCGEESYNARETKRIFFACLGVSIASITESFGDSICKRVKFPYVRNKRHKDGMVQQVPIDRPNWGDRTKALNKGLGIKVENLAGFAESSLARKLGNSYKHKRGRADEKMAKELGVALDSEIEYENREWRKIIEGVGKFLAALADSMPAWSG